jgi:hypothetical protein
LQSVVDDKEQVNELSTKDLKNLFKLRTGTPSDTHDKLRCERCKIIQDHAEVEALKVLPKKLTACCELVDLMMEHEDSQYFHKPLLSQDHGVSKEAYEKSVKQPMDLGTIKARLGMSQDLPSSYKSVSSVSKDVNRIFANVMKVWSPGDDIADAARRIQGWWVEQWTELVPRLMVMKSDEDFSQKEDDFEAPNDILEGCATLNNERGEDYQEQIGMPDEENMRSWSHHHTTDTVDDPVFRAAMRGCDSVSFVFGLEVTWSLIQQRQQEEEERKALKELECIQELDGSEEVAAAEGGADEADVDDDGASSFIDNDEVAAEGEAGVDDDGASSFIDNDEVAAEAEAGVDDDGASSFIDNEDDHGDIAVADSNEASSDDASIQEEITMTADDSEESVSSSQQLEAQDSTSTPEAEVQDSPSGESNVVDVLSASQVSSNFSSTDKENETPSPSKKEWECSACTLFNKKSYRKCKACGTKRPNSAVGTKRAIEELSS